MRKGVVGAHVDPSEPRSSPKMTARWYSIVYCLKFISMKSVVSVTSSNFLGWIMTTLVQFSSRLNRILEQNFKDQLRVSLQDCVIGGTWCAFLTHWPAVARWRGSGFESRPADRRTWLQRFSWLLSVPYMRVLPSSFKMTHDPFPPQPLNSSLRWSC
jgi:hypothetical protein